MLVLVWAWAWVQHLWQTQCYEKEKVDVFVLVLVLKLVLVLTVKRVVRVVEHPHLFSDSHSQLQPRLVEQQHLWHPGQPQSRREKMKVGAVVGARESFW